MTDKVEVTEVEMIIKTIEYLKSLVVPSKDLAFIYTAVCILSKTIGEGGGTYD